MPRPKQAKRNSPPPPPPHRLKSVFDDPPRKNVLLLTCMDQRLLDDIVRFMNGLNLHNRYDQLALAGAAMGALQLPAQNSPDTKWKTVFFIHLQAAIDLLHRPIKDIFLLEHLDCGAYKELHPNCDVQEQYPDADWEGMISFHRQELNDFANEVARYIDAQRQLAEADFHAAREACEKCETQAGEQTCWKRVEKLAEEKVKAWTDIRVSCFVMDLIGEVTQLDVPREQRATLQR